MSSLSSLLPGPSNGHGTESELRQKILNIRNNTALTPQQKSIEIQLVMQGKSSNLPESGYSTRPISEVENVEESSTVASLSKRTRVQVPNLNRECKHYVKSCSQFYFSCCDTMDPCHRCHLERGCDMAPPQVVRVSCNLCDMKQPPVRVCANDSCERIFSSNYCSICRVWTQSDIFHCVG